MTPDNPRDAALTYAARFGWPVLPTDRTDKTPIGRLVPNGVHDASTDPGVISGWFERFPGANVAVATGAPGPQVLDVDHPELAPALIAGLHAGAEALTGRTDSIGRHLYFNGDDHRTRKWPWGELRGVGSYVVAPPSVHASGRSYAWLQEPGVALDPVPAAVLALVEEVEREPFTRRINVPHGERHGYLQRYAEQLVAVQGYRDEKAIIAELEAEFMRACVLSPAPRPDEFRSLARWVAGTELMTRLRRRDSGVLALTRALAKGRGLPSHEKLLAIVEQAGGWGDRLELVGVFRHGDRPIDALEVRFTNGGRAYFPKQGDITASVWAKTLIAATSGAARPPGMKTPEFMDLYRALMLLAPPPRHNRTEAEEIADEVGVMLSLTEPVFGHSLETAGERFELIAALRARERWEPGNALSKDAPALIHIGDDRYLRGGDLWTWICHRRLQIAPGAFPGRMAMVGLEQVVVDGREPRRAPGERRATWRTTLYRLPADDDD